MQRCERYAAAGRILLISGFFCVALWLDGALLVTRAAPGADLVFLAQQVVYWGLWFGPVAFVLLGAGCACRLRAKERGTATRGA
jgi:hypothetical protein